MIARSLNIINILGDFDSALLFGPRGVGKTALCLSFLSSLPKNKTDTLIIDLLDRDTFKQHSDNPGLLKSIIRERLSATKILTVLIDEVQRIPSILDDVHSLLEEDSREGKKRVRFIATGSSARKLKKEGANLLAGRAHSLKLYPITFEEYSYIDQKALHTGLLPSFYFSQTDPIPRLKSYADTYIREEVFQESIVRNSAAFSRFVDLAVQLNGEPINFSKLGRAARIASTTVENYFTILVDILLARRVDVWSYSVKTQMTAQPKFYFFDCGVLNALRNELSALPTPGSYRYGKLFETLVINQLAALLEYHSSDLKMYYWRTKGGAEVDLILSKGPQELPIAVEIKSVQTPDKQSLRGLFSVKAEYPNAKLFCLCNTTQTFEIDGVKIINWREGILQIAAGSN